ncbi:hypothetical protein [Gilliamella sp. ESL0250]|uniref:hypothetical protein n=1 Tax=Gilliamella sp. ESL0250 TaxID=2705036 RepID=UPI0015805EF4|nr:hypothetical protein [Gilliamella sp. ESL0250]NUF50289.1 hypothetical protein [Gilliamella sp. ESL0250]
MSKLPKFSLLLLSYSEGSQALTAHTSKIIEGSAPYLTFDEGLTKETSTDSLLFIKLQNGRVITPSTNTSSATSPISLPYVGNTLGDIDMLIPSSVSSVSLNDLVNRYNYWRDDDGDGQGTNGVTATGNISVSFTDRDGSAVSRSDGLSICSAPYRVRLESSGGTLTTQYGVPRSISFSGGTVDYYINPNSPQPVICSVRPNLKFGTDDYAGPSNIWNPTKGFLVQSTSSSSYDRNFPTTGADGLYFDLLIDGVDASQLSWSVITSGDITATVSWTRPRSGTFTSPTGKTIQADEWIIDKSSYVTRITLRGPSADSTQMQSADPSPLIKPSLPQTFELVGKDSRGNKVSYGFVLRQWFVNRGSEFKKSSAHKTWCNRLGYSMPKARDLSNSVRGVSRYKRYIGAGLFTEWGYMKGYSDAGFVGSSYFADGYSTVHSSTGIIGKDHSNMIGIRRSGYGICTAP